TAAPDAAHLATADPPRASATTLWSHDEGIEQMQNEIRSLRQLLEQQMSGLAWNNYGRSHPLWAGLLRRFGQLGLEPELARSIVEQIPQNTVAEKAWRLALAYLSYRIQINHDNLLTPVNAVAFVGASGVGKTTTLAKLATRFVMQEGNENIILATTDHYRIGGRDHLRGYGRILGVPVRTLQTATDISVLLDRYFGQKLILIDTAGLSPRDERQEQQLSLLQAVQSRLKICRVLSANSQLSVLQHSARKTPVLVQNQAIVTKLDEATSLGSLLSVLITANLQVSHVSDGQKVPDDLHDAEPHTLVSRAIACMNQNRESLQSSETIEQEYGKSVMNVSGEIHEH
ncbi:MAG: flagellar biosynthesis protein FlhF, partial [Gammaproteobacteria bacterium]|nr:flagellar biosynthesis protein FlhF [Gammaproteobacteria bacterium]